MAQDVDNNKTIMLILNSYLHSSYRVHVGEQEILLKIGQQQPQLDALLQEVEKPALSWAVLSGHNPGSEVLSDAVNYLANQQLQARIKILGLDYWQVTAGDCQDDFPDEDCFLIAGIEPQMLAELAIDFGQNAAVIGSVSSVASLLVFPQVWQGIMELRSMPDFVDSYSMEKEPHES